MSTQEGTVTRWRVDPHREAFWAPVLKHHGETREQYETGRSAHLKKQAKKEGWTRRELQQCLTLVKQIAEKTWPSTSTGND